MSDLLRAALSELHAAGVRDVTVAVGGKHRQVRFRVNGQDHAITVAGTPSDVRSVANSRADIRRMLRALGVIIDSEPKTPTRQPSRIEQLEARLARVEAKLASLPA